MRTEDSPSPIDPRSGQGLAGHLLEELHPRRALPSLAAGLITGVVTLAMSAAFGMLIFSGPLSPYLSRGIGLMLFGSIVIGGIAALTSSLPGLVAGIQDTGVVILALVAAAIVQNMAVSATPEETFLTVVAAIAAASFLTGAAFLLIGSFKLANTIRFVPYPVIGGFLAGTGLLLAFGAVSVMIDEPVSLARPLPLLDSAHLAGWLPGLVFAAALLAATRRSNHVLIVPGMLAAGFALFYALLWLAGVSVSDAVTAGWLLPPLSTEHGELWRPFGVSDIRQVNWSALSAHSGSLVVIAVVSALSVLLNAAGIELATQQDVDLNRELKVAGLANLVAGLGGGMVGYHSLSRSALAFRMGARGRLVGLTLAAVCCGVLLGGGPLLFLFPKPLLGGLLLFLGLEFLASWAYDGWFRFPRADYCIVISIMVVMNCVGFAEGVGLGIILAVVLFIVDYSRVNVVKHTLSGANYHSNVDRPRTHSQLLRDNAHWIHVFELQGFLFFGTATKLHERVRQRLNLSDVPPPRFILLDFRRVSGFDSSAVLSFAKMRQQARRRGAVLILTQLSPAMRRQLRRDSLEGENHGQWHIFPDMDHGIEWCENEMLGGFEIAQTQAEPSTSADQLQHLLPGPTGFEGLRRYLTRERFEPGHCLIRQGDAPKGLFFLEEGQLRVHLEFEDGKSGRRLRTMTAGTVVGEIGLFLGIPATASVTVERPSTLYCLPAENLERIEEEAPEVATNLHRFVIRTLSERLARTNETLRALLD